MNRKNLTAAVLAGLAGAAGIVGSAQAVNINPDGLGQVLIYPYYTTNGGNQTLLSVVNTTDEAKAVKVRFKEGKNSREVLDFNLYMSAWDVWTAAIYDAETACAPTAETPCDPAPTLETGDTTCTVPYLYGDYDGTVAFLPWGMNDTGVADTYGPISRATEGYFEMIEMGVLTGDSAAAATHKDGVPADCDSLVDAWTVFDDKDNDLGYWLEDPLEDIEAPSGGMFGGAAIINVTAGHMYSYDARAINDFATVRDPNLAPLHNPPGDSSPSLNSGGVTDATVFVDGTSLPSDGLARGVDAVSFVFMHDQVMNEYTTEKLVGAATEWVLTFPTKSYYVYDDESGSTEPVAPFISTWDGTTETSCEIVELNTIYDRNEQTIVPTIPGGEPIPPIVSPAPPDIEIPPNPIVPFELCYEVSVIQFGAYASTGIDVRSEILGSSNFHTIDNTALGFVNGWARLDMYNYVSDDDENGVPEVNTREELGGLNGLPVTGFSVQRSVNGFLGDGADVLANYGGILQHKYTRKLGSLGGGAGS